MSEKDKNKPAGKSPANKATEEAAKKSAENRSKGKENVQFSLTKRIHAVYIKDGKFAKKGTETVLSEKGFAALKAKGLVKEA